ncbi:MAG: glutamate synthase [Eggerthellaceae bacterium]|nr:glutamate synthase [Eggerthellaceae bacterium]
MAEAQTNKVVVELGTAHFQEANVEVRAALEQADVVELRHVYAQRYLGCTMPEGKRLEIHGTPGNDMACYMDGGSIEVFGNAQDQIGNTMNAGEIVIHGRCGDAAGYAMRGGEVFVRDDCGWRVGIHMKQYEQKCPTVVIGGNAGSFLGEYMAGGIIVLLGHPGEYLATGMHGGVIYLKNKLPEEDVPQGLVLEEVDAGDKKTLACLLGKYNEYFADDLGKPIEATGEGFWRLRPESSRPYASMYA